MHIDRPGQTHRLPSCYSPLTVLLVPAPTPTPSTTALKKIPTTTGISHSLLKASSSLSSTGLGSSLISYEYLYTATCNKLQLAAGIPLLWYSTEWLLLLTQVCPRVWLSKVDLMAAITTFSPLLFLATELPAQLAATLNICAFPKCSGSHRWD